MQDVEELPSGRNIAKYTKDLLHLNTDLAAIRAVTSQFPEVRTR